MTFSCEIMATDGFEKYTGGIFEEYHILSMVSRVLFLQFYQMSIVFA